MKSRLFVEVSPPRPLYQRLLGFRQSDGLSGSNELAQELPT
jgi:hypothetical protein